MWGIREKKGLQLRRQVAIYGGDWKCGCSSVVERHVANVAVVSSNLITRFWQGSGMLDYPHGYSCA